MRSRLPAISSWMYGLALPAAMLRGCGNGPEIRFESIEPCITRVSVQIAQGSRSANRAGELIGGSFGTFVGDWVDWSKSLRVVLRVLEVLDDPAYRESFPIGTELAPMEPLAVHQQNEPVVFDVSTFGNAPPSQTSTAPAACNLEVIFRDGRTDSHHTGTHSDFQLVEHNGQQLPPERTDGTSNNKLGYYAGVYTIPGPAIVGYGFFKKLELHARVNAPCAITGMTRVMETLPGHNFTAAGSGSDGPAPASIHVESPQHWYVTDAPGMLVADVDGANGKVFHKRYTMTITGTDGGTPAAPWEANTSYDVWIGVDASHKLRTPPPSHSR